MQSSIHGPVNGQDSRNRDNPRGNKIDRERQRCRGSEISDASTLGELQTSEDFTPQGGYSLASVHFRHHLLGG